MKKGFLFSKEESEEFHFSEQKADVIQKFVDEDGHGLVYKISHKNGWFGRKWRLEKLEEVKLWKFAYKRGI